ncbi:MAG: cytochrome c oxidase subunit 3 [Saprospiraceae bacterium]|nr:cytochrome c oxidase subunit 3 [Saprospiraceae bacterium]MBK8546506.1 cytochrome c oxidase subunit 3 [Saprospiraceae bacterium]
MNNTMTNKRNLIDAQKFALYAAMASISMMFAAFLSAYIVKQASGNWLEFSLPSTFYLSTVLVLLISAVLHKTKSFINTLESGLYKSGIVVALVLSILFIISQYTSWNTLVERGVDLKGNVSGSFLYLITGIHVLHVIGGVVALIISAVYAFIFPIHTHPEKGQKFDLVVNYWHFVDVLWIVLFLFLMFYK